MGGSLHNPISLPQPEVALYTDASNVVQFLPIEHERLEKF